MKSFKPRLILASSLLALFPTAHAASVISTITASGDGLGAVTDVSFNNVARILSLEKTFDSVDPITLTFTIGHSTGPAGPFDVTESITNSTGTDWIDFHYSIVEPSPPQGVVFTSFNSSTYSGMILESPPTSVPRNLNFVGSQPDGAIATASFNLSFPDPGANNTYTAQLTQLPTIPIPAAAWLLGSGLLGLLAVARRKT
jgi:hypothetical protein